MRNFCSIIFLIISAYVQRQDLKYSDQEIKIKLDSIKAEGDLLYSLENASWHSNDIARNNSEIKDLISIYLTYISMDAVKTVFLDRSGKQVIAEYTFLNNSKIPNSEDLTPRNLNALEKDLKNVREKLLPQLEDPKYEVGVPQGFSLNVITIPFGQNFKTYLIPGTAKSGIIPFGNDYLFVTDKNGKILKNIKFHSRLIPTESLDDPDKTMVMATHSHLATTPFISATDICTFKLYALFINLDLFSVYSPALKIYFEYSLKEDSLKARTNLE